MKLSLRELHNYIASLRILASNWEETMVVARSAASPPIKVDIHTGKIQHDPEAFKKEVDELVRQHLQTVYKGDSGRFEKAYYILRMIEDLALIGINEIQL